MNPHSSSHHDWMPSATMECLRVRSRVLRRIREYFASARVMEVETPSLSASASSDPSLQSFATELRFTGDLSGTPLYLHTSPEFPMKRLLAAGSGAIFQICKVFRNGEVGQVHNPEFTMLEWYRPGFDHHRLMDDVEALLRFVAAGQVEFPVAERYTYQSLFRRYLDVDPFTADRDVLRECARRQGVDAPEGMESDRPEPWRDLLLSHAIEPALPDGPVFVYDFPPSQAALARIRDGEVPVAERFELYCNRIELANGFHELTDAGEQRRRIQRELDRRRRDGEPQLPVDDRFLGALDAGLPDSAGVAVGIDRLIMAVAGLSTIQQTLAFPIERA